MTSNELLLLFKQRQSVRAYADRSVEQDKLLRCIEAAQLAPSACNAQPWKYIVINDPELKNEIADHITNKLLSMNHFTRQAPVLIAIVREPANFTSSVGQVLKNKEYPLMDIGISAIQFCLQATAEGLGTCIMGWFDEKKIKKLLHVPVTKRLELIITLGYPVSDEIRPKIRKNIDSILSYNGY